MRSVCRAICRFLQKTLQWVVLKKLQMKWVVARQIQATHRAVSLIVLQAAVFPENVPEGDLRRGLLEIGIKILGLRTRTTVMLIQEIAQQTRLGGKLRATKVKVVNNTVEKLMNAGSFILRDLAAPRCQGILQVSGKHI